MIRTYIVVFQLEGRDKNLTTQVVTDPVRNTDFESIRKIVAVKRAARVDHVEIISVQLISAEEETQGPVIINIHGANHGNIQM